MKFKQASEAANWLMSLKNKNDLIHFKEILTALNIPYDQLPCIHVTGTNGKGSTINYLRHILQNANYRVGTFTSPYMICHQDRICINGQMIGDEDFVELVNRYYAAIEQYHLSMFESDVLLMIVYFLVKKVDLAIVEVGIGGRKDKTNVVSPMASVITNIGNDHLKQMGPTLEDVAYQKAGIIKDHIPVYIGEMTENLQTVIEKEAALHHSQVHVCHPARENDTKNFEYLGLKHLSLNDVGAYQIKNACMAIKIIRDLFPNVSNEAIYTGLKEAIWPGRFEHFVVYGKDVYLDGAHNTDAFEVLFEAVEHIRQGRQVTMIYAALKDKEYEKMAASILERGYVLRVCQFEDDRALSQAQALSIHAMAYDDSIESAIASIKNMGGMIVVCGSLHFISQFRMKLLEKNCNLT